MTPPCFERMTKELYQLQNKERPEVVKTISWAAGNGDRSENADYIYGKKRLREIDSRIRFLNKRLNKVIVIDPKTQKSDFIVFGATVKLTYEDGSQKIIQIVGADEIDINNNKISWVSPLGKALLGKKRDDVIILNTPSGSMEIQIDDFSFK
jgi:transcription elongation factor GreB